MVIESGISWVEGDGLFVLGDGLIQFSLPRISVPKIVVPEGIRGVEGDGLFVLCNGLIQLPFARISVPKIVVSMRYIRVEFKYTQPESLAVLPDIAPLPG